MVGRLAVTASGSVTRAVGCLPGGLRLSRGLALKLLPPALLNGVIAAMPETSLLKYGSDGTKGPRLQSLSMSMPSRRRLDNLGRNQIGVRATGNERILRSQSTNCAKTLGRFARMANENTSTSDHSNEELWAVGLSIVILVATTMANTMTKGDISCSVFARRNQSTPPVCMSCLVTGLPCPIRTITRLIAIARVVHSNFKLTMVRLPDAQFESLATRLGFDPMFFDDELDGDMPPLESVETGEVDDGEQLEKQKRKNIHAGAHVELFESYEQTKHKEDTVSDEQVLDEKPAGKPSRETFADEEEVEKEESEKSSDEEDNEEEAPKAKVKRMGLLKTNNELLFVVRSSSGLRIGRAELGRQTAEQLSTLIGLPTGVLVSSVEDDLRQIVDQDRVAGHLREHLSAAPRQGDARLSHSRGHTKFMNRDLF